jgi:hypothetical protein
VKPTSSTTSSATVREPQARQVSGGGGGEIIHAPCKHARRDTVLLACIDLHFWTRSDDAAWSCRNRPSQWVKRYMLLHGYNNPAQPLRTQRCYRLILGDADAYQTRVLADPARVERPDSRRLCARRLGKV